MAKDIVNLDAEEIYLPEEIKFQLHGKEYIISRPTVRKRMEYVKLGGSLTKETDPEKIVNTLIDLCVLAVDGLEREELYDCTEAQLAKIMEMISECYGLKEEGNDQDSEKNLPKKKRKGKSD